MRFRPVMLSVLAFTAAMLPVNASADGFRLRVEDMTSGTPYGVVLTDQGAGDEHPEPGLVMVTLNPLNSTVTWNLTMGMSKPLTPFAGAIGELFLQSFNITSTGKATIRVTLEDTGFVGKGSGYDHLLTSDVSGNFCVPEPGGPANPCTDKVSFTTTSWANASNQVPGLGPDVTTPSNLTAISMVGGTNTAEQDFESAGTSHGSFSGQEFVAFEDSGPSYSLFTQLLITFDGAGSVDFYQDITMTANERLVPEPATLLLIGTGLAGLAARRRRYMMNV